MTVHAIIDVLQSIAIVGLCVQVAILRRRSAARIDLRGPVDERLFRSTQRTPPPRPDGAPPPSRPSR
jgi:hypothetical protein